mmetsp:Transcript_43463/g.138360  ORF Transcript_43463/g.138360 Transcript_43463/m.138360 type:complete len:216 (+) Transcript_43463:872-1519(+)
MLFRISSTTTPPGTGSGHGPSCESAVTAPAKPVGLRAAARCSSCSATSCSSSAGLRSSKAAIRRAMCTTCKSGSSVTAREISTAKPPCQRAGGMCWARANAVMTSRSCCGSKPSHMAPKSCRKLSTRASAQSSTVGSMAASAAANSRCTAARPSAGCRGGCGSLAATTASLPKRRWAERRPVAWRPRPTEWRPRADATATAAGRMAVAAAVAGGG